MNPVVIKVFKKIGAVVFYELSKILSTDEKKTRKKTTKIKPSNNKCLGSSQETEKQ
ncbi:MAG: hypothetical protein N3A58_00025 [Spirochaetes bacterium]|nr:hypothetical protein [Spirochaetota bacterium]